MPTWTLLGMSALSVWGLMQSIIVTITIIMNGKGMRSGWFAGAVTQAVMLVFGYGLFGAVTFLFLAIPMAGFIYNYMQYPAREQRRRAIIINEYRAAEQKRREAQAKFMPDNGINNLLGVPIMKSSLAPPDSVIVMRPDTLDSLQKRMDDMRNKWVNDWVAEYAKRKPWQAGGEVTGEEPYRDNDYFRFKKPVNVLEELEAFQHSILHPPEGVKKDDGSSTSTEEVRGTDSS